MYNKHSFMDGVNADRMMQVCLRVLSLLICLKLIICWHFSFRCTLNINTAQTVFCWFLCVKALCVFNLLNFATLLILSSFCLPLQPQTAEHVSGTAGVKMPSKIKDEISNLKLKTNLVWLPMCGLCVENIVVRIRRGNCYAIQLKQNVLC